MTSDVIQPEWKAPAHVKVVSTTRSGGVSHAPYDSMNLGLHVGDDAQAVQENRRRLVERHGMPGQPVWLRQVHGVSMLAADDPVDDPCADGAWTGKHGNPVVVVTADCLPVVLTDSEGTRVAAVHAGWRGLSAGVLEQAVGVFTKGEPLHAWLGPAIGPAAFEVGEDVRAAFVQRRADFATAFVERNDAGKYLADLYALARTELSSLASVEISGGTRCTYTEVDLFHSHRRDGAASGRMGTFAWLE